MDDKLKIDNPGWKSTYDGNAVKKGDKSNPGNVLVYDVNIVKALKVAGFFTVTHELLGENK
jgi:hypothetical protein